MTPLRTVYSKNKEGDTVTRADLMRAETPDDLPSWRICTVSRWGFDLTDDSALGPEGEPASEAEYKAMYAVAAKRVAEFNGYAATDASTCPW